LPADCDAPDDLSIEVGADTDQNMATALTLLETGACPTALATSATPQKPLREEKLLREERRGRPWQEFANAW
jgi:hypothetical protein